MYTYLFHYCKPINICNPLNLAYLIILMSMWYFRGVLRLMGLQCVHGKLFPCYHILYYLPYTVALHCHIHVKWPMSKFRREWQSTTFYFFHLHLLTFTSFTCLYLHILLSLAFFTYIYFFHLHLLTFTSFTCIYLHLLLSLAFIYIYFFHLHLLTFTSFTCLYLHLLLSLAFTYIYFFYLHLLTFTSFTCIYIHLLLSLAVTYIYFFHLHLLTFTSFTCIYLHFTSFTCYLYTSTHSLHAHRKHNTMYFR